MNLTALATLLTILDKGSFAAAAQTVGCTPGAVSLQVKQLETWFGRPLFDRSGRTAKPTAFAQEAAATLRPLVHEIGRLRARRAPTVAGRVRLGAIATIQTDALPRALRLLRDRHPALAIDVVLADSDGLQTELRAGRIDAAALVRPPAGGSSRFVWQELTRQGFVMLAPSASTEDSPAELIARWGWIRYDTIFTGGRQAARYVRSIDARARATLELASVDAIVAMIAAGLGVSVVPQPRAAILRAHRVRSIPLGRAAPVRTIALARRAPDADDRNIDAIHAAFVTAYSVR